MKLLPDNQPLDYSLMWRCHSCSKWNREDAESCSKCALERPIQPHEAKPKQNLIRMLDTVIAYCEDTGMNTCMPIILRAVLIALLTGTEGSLAELCRVFGQLHNFYRRDGDKILNFQNRWRPVKK